MIEIKICGLTTRDDALMALEAGADFLGFVLYPRSPRAITPSQLRRVAEGLPPGARCVAVAVNEAPDRLAALAADCGLHAVQVHGDEAAADYAAAPFRVWRAVRFEGDALSPDPESWRAERLVLDAAAPGGIYGGTGCTADWARAAGLARRQRVMLAGGLNAANVAEAIRQVRPVGVDTASGVEAEPGRKDRSRMTAFIRAVRTAAASLAPAETGGGPPPA